MDKSPFSPFISEKSSTHFFRLRSNSSLRNYAILKQNTVGLLINELLIATNCLNTSIKSMIIVMQPIVIPQSVNLSIHAFNASSLL